MNNHATHKSGRSIFCLFIAFFISILAARVQAQDSGTVTGTVRTTVNSKTLQGANVIILGTKRGSSTNKVGVYKLKIRQGVYTIRASFIGRETVEQKIRVVAGETTTIDFQLAETAVQFGESIVVIGSRTARTAVESTVPIDIISSIEIRQSGFTEVNQLLTHFAPSFNASHQTISDGTDHINPASLRGLGPDQVLVLINGKRRHQSALVHVNGTFGRGTVGVDLNSIPVAAIDRIEVLRDGAAAQYGSDAIAGVINIVLKEQASEIQINSMAGVTAQGDGKQLKTDINYGLRIGEKGFFNITGEFFDRGRTNRSGTWTGDIFPGISGTAETDAELKNRGLTRDDFSMKTGQGAARIGAVFFNTAVPLNEHSDFYAFGGFTHRKGFATGFFRLPNSEARVNLNTYPNGFLPEIHTEVDDDAFTAGVRGIRNGWDVDISLTTGGNAFQFNIENSINASIGESSPTSFDAGRLKFRQTTGNVDLVRLLNTQGIVNSLSIVLGGEFRIENYKIEAGENASWQLGNGVDNPIAGVDYDTTASGAPKNAGSQVFPGFQPSNEVNRLRNSISAYAGFESQVTDMLMLDIGGRFENYSDFGSTFIAKAATRFEPLKNFALRGAVSTGFRAPSLHQIWFNNVSTQFILDDNNALVAKRVLTGSNHSAVTKAFGIPALKEETSVNFSAGFTVRPVNNFSITADVFSVTIKDRIVLSSRFSDSDPVVAEILKPFEKSGIGQAQFFANAVDTKTNGVDIVAVYYVTLGKGRLTLTGTANKTRTEVEAINIPEGVAEKFADGDLEAVKNTLFNREERNRLEDALPGNKASFSARYTLGRISASTRAIYYGEIQYKPTNPDNDETFSAKTLLDIDLSYEIIKGVGITIGAHNILNTFPDEHQKESNRSSERFIYSRRVTQFGMNGAFYYGRLQFNL
ncbi:TonB-dependent receptor [bacterium]|nr:TonB-dependent receptor [bacterium]